MKKFIFSLIICSLFFQQRTFAQELKSDLLFNLEIDLKPPQVVGPVLKGTRLISPFRDGFVKGDPQAILFTGRLYEEGTPLRLALAFEKNTEWHNMHPKVDW